MKPARHKGKKAVFICQATETHLKVLKCVCLKGTKRQIAALEIEPLAEGADEQKLAEAFVGVFRRLRYNSEPVIVSLPRQNVTCRYLKIPATNPVEVEQMATLQATRFLPYPAQELTSGFQIIGVDKQGYAEVNLVIAHKHAVERYTNIFKELKPASLAVLLSSFGLANLYYYLEPKQADKAMLVDLDGNQAEVVVVEGQRLLFSRAFKINSVHAGWEELFIEQIAKTNDLYLKETTKALPEKMIFLCLQKDRLAARLESLKGKTRAEIAELYYAEKVDFAPGAEGVIFSSGVSLASLVGLSLAPVRDSLNLLPVEIKVAARMKSRQKERLQAALSVMAILLMFAFGLSRSLENKARYLEKLKAELNKVSQEARPLEELEKRFLVLERYARKKLSSLDVLYELHKNTPVEISLLNFIYEENGSLTIHGQAPELNSVFNFVAQLDKSAVFKHNIKVRYATKKRTAAGEVIDFEIVC
jgi:Tfp pilus assembly PilM family ATPase